jgi:hypothetical protein
MGANFLRAEAPSTRRKAKSLKETFMKFRPPHDPVVAKRIDAQRQGETAAAAEPPGGTDY